MEEVKFKKWEHRKALKIPFPLTHPDAEENTNNLIQTFPDLLLTHWGTHPGNA